MRLHCIYGFPLAETRGTGTIRHALRHVPQGLAHPRRPLFTVFRLLLISILSIPIFLSSLPYAHALTADELLIVANRTVPESVDLARYYMLKRNVPSGNLLLVKTSDKEQIGRQDYDQQIARPVREFLARSDPGERRFRCIVLMYGMPLRVLPPPLTAIESRRLQELQTVLKKTPSVRTSPKKGAGGSSRRSKTNGLT